MVLECAGHRRNEYQPNTAGLQWGVGAVSEAQWTGNFRDLAGAVARMATLAPGGRITPAVVDDEIERLRMVWRGPAEGASDSALVDRYLDGQLKLDEMVTGVYQLDELPRAFEDMLAGRNAKAVLVMG